MSMQISDAAGGRIIRYDEAVREAIDQEMDRDENVLVMGIGVDDAKAIYNTTTGLLEKYGPERVFDTPLAEDAMTGVAIGAAQAGLRPIHVHIRMDFLLLAGKYDSVRGDGVYTEAIDLDGDGRIAFTDFILFADAYGR